MPSALRHTYQANPLCPYYNYYICMIDSKFQLTIARILQILNCAFSHQATYNHQTYLTITLVSRIAIAIQVTHAEFPRLHITCIYSRLIMKLIRWAKLYIFTHQVKIILCIHSTHSVTLFRSVLVIDVTPVVGCFRGSRFRFGYGMIPTRTGRLRFHPAGSHPAHYPGK